MNPNASVNQAHLHFSMPDDNKGEGKKEAEWNQLIGSHQQGITKSTCHPAGSSNPVRGPEPCTAALRQTAPHAHIHTHSHQHKLS